MGKAIATTWIRARSDEVWAVLADYYDVARWHPGVARVTPVGEPRRGVGATRHCVFLPEGEVKERATAWREGRELAVVLSEADWGLDGATVRFTVDPEAGATLAGLELVFPDPARPDERLAMEHALGERAYLLLKSLKHYAETGTRMPIPPQWAAEAAAAAAGAGSGAEVRA